MKNSSFLAATTTSELLALIGVFFTTVLININNTIAITTSVPLNSFVNLGADSNLTGWTQNGSSSAIRDTGGTINSGYNPRSGAGCFAGGFGSGGAPSSLYQNVNLLGGAQNFVAAQLDSGTLHVEIIFYYQNWYSLLVSTDSAQVTVVFRSASNAVLVNVSSGPQISGTNPGWCLYSNVVSLPVNTRRIDYIMQFIRNGGTNIDSYIDENSPNLIYQCSKIICALYSFSE